MTSAGVPEPPQLVAAFERHSRAVARRAAAAPWMPKGCRMEELKPQNPGDPGAFHSHRGYPNSWMVDFRENPHENG